MPNDTPGGTTAPAETAPTTITFFAPKEKSKGIKRTIKSWPSLFETFSKAKPPTTKDKNAQAGWSPATFTGDTRKAANVELVHALVLDYDAGNTTPEQAIEVWAGHLGCVYTSWSHTPAKPKFRLIVPFSRGVNADEYAVIWQNAASKVKAAGHEIDEACKDPSRLWYLPCKRDDNFKVLTQGGKLLVVDELLVVEAPEIELPRAEAVVQPTAVPAGSKFVAEVKERSRLEDLIHPVHAWDKKTPDDWWCSSPLRQGDSTASFHIKVGEQLWYDFGLADGGDVFVFLQKLWGCDFKTALKRRAKELGITRPIDLDFDNIDGFVVTEHDSQIVSAAEVAGSTSMAIVEKKPRFPSTDLGNAERFALRYGQDVRYVPAWDKWIVWTGKQWKIDDLKRVDRFAQVTVRAIYREAQDEADMDRRKALAEHAKKSEAHARKVALLDHAKSLPEIPITPMDLDTDRAERDAQRIKFSQRVHQVLEAAEQPTHTMSEAERDEALALLRDPQLVERIVTDFDKCGIVGEHDNKLIGYLATVSRRLDEPLAVVVQSSSAAGKSSLLDAVLRFVPDEEQVAYSAMTGQSLFYMGGMDLKHKVLAIAEEAGAHQAAYALRVLQSSGELSIASTGKDQQTGRLSAHEYRVQGPVAILLTTTALDVDDELLNRCLVLTVDESAEQTAAIQELQRQARTLGGLLARRARLDVERLHQNAQRLLVPLAVVNPFAPELTFSTGTTRSRRDQKKLLTLIDTIAFLHQHQRPVRSVEVGTGTIKYIEVRKADIELAVKLSSHLLGHGTEDVPPQTGNMLMAIRAMVAKSANEQATDPQDVRFTRRQLRERFGWGERQTRVHLDRLTELEYVVRHRGGHHRLVGSSVR
jgi:hypothetical protein